TRDDRGKPDSRLASHVHAPVDASAGLGRELGERRRLVAFVRAREHGASAKERHAREQGSASGATQQGYGFFHHGCSSQADAPASASIFSWTTERKAVSRAPILSRAACQAARAASM